MEEKNKKWIINFFSVLLIGIKSFPYIFALSKPSETDKNIPRLLLKFNYKEIINYHKIFVPVL
jgi:hypothetical protein